MDNFPQQKALKGWFFRRNQPKQTWKMGRAGLRFVSHYNLFKARWLHNLRVHEVGSGKCKIGKVSFPLKHIQPENLSSHQRAWQNIIVKWTLQQWFEKYHPVTHHNFSYSPASFKKWSARRYGTDLNMLMGSFFPSCSIKINVFYSALTMHFPDGTCLVLSGWILNKLKLCYAGH